MASISYQVNMATGQVSLENVAAGVAAPTGGSGCIEVRVDQTANALTDAGSTRSIRKSEVYHALMAIWEYVQKDVTYLQG